MKKEYVVMTTVDDFVDEQKFDSAAKAAKEIARQLDVNCAVFANAEFSSIDCGVWSREDYSEDYRLLLAIFPDIHHITFFGKVPSAFLNLVNYPN